MSLVALTGSATFLLREATLQKILLPLVAFSAGSLLGGAFFHLIPGSLDKPGQSTFAFIWVLIGFSLFLAVEQFLHWHHCRKAVSMNKKPLTYLILIGDGIHNFIGGLAVAGAFLLDIRLGVTAWIAAAAHEIPQELGDMSVLLYGGWTKLKALIFNLLSASTFLVGGILAFFASFQFDVSFLIPFAAGNFIYIAASDLVPEVNKNENIAVNVGHFISFISGLGVMLIAKVIFD